VEGGVKTLEPVAQYVSTMSGRELVRCRKAYGHVKGGFVSAQAVLSAWCGFGALSRGRSIRRPLPGSQSQGGRRGATAVTYGRCSREPGVVGDGVGGLAMYYN
jgi:hypothetical protein